MTLGVLVFNTSNVQVGDFATIQAAANDAGTLNGYTLRVIQADYNPVVPETVNVTKQVTIETDVNAGVDPNTAIRSPEVVVERFDINADNVTIDGFTVAGTSSGTTVHIQNGATNASVLNNIITNNATSVVRFDGAGEVRANTISQTANTTAVFRPYVGSAPEFFIDLQPLASNIFEHGRKTCDYRAREEARRTCR